MLALARQFGNDDLQALSDSGADSIFFHVPGVGMIHYSLATGWGLAIICLGLWVGCFMMVRRQGGGSLGEITSSTYSFFQAFIALVLASHPDDLD